MMQRYIPQLILLLVLVFVVRPAPAYPEFQAFVVKKTRRPINCAMCHVHADGPEGTAPGQIGRLTPAEFERLGLARTALAPGQSVDSPILNSFGNHIITSIGKTKFAELKVSPGALAELLPQDSDLDHDGIPDVREYLEGTHPVNRHDGNPWLLFVHNFNTNLTAILLTLAATVAGMWGLKHLLNGFATAARIKETDEEDSH